MRTTANLLIVFVTWGLLAPGSAALAGSNAAAGGAAIAIWSVGQSARPGGADSRHEADQWLAQARRAIQDGDLELADYYVERAEKLNASYDGVFDRFQDSPERVRQDLAKLPQQPETGSPDSPSPLSLAQLVRSRDGQAAPPSDPLAARTGAKPVRTPSPAADSSLSEPDRLPPPHDLNRLSSFAGASPERGGAEPGPTESRVLLRDARRALAQRDLKQAAQWAAQAKALGKTYQPHEDSPAKLDALISRAKLLYQGPAAASDQNEFSRDLARFLMEQADGLIPYRDLDQAEHLALEAKALAVEFRGFERTPEQLLRQIQKQKETRIAAGGGAGTAGPSADPPVRENKAHALQLVALARMALDRGDVNGAQGLANQARELHVPDSAYAPDETRPWQVLLEVNQARNRRSPGVAPAVGFRLADAHEGAPGPEARPVRPGVYTPDTDTSRNVLASHQQPAAAGSQAMGHYQEGLEALSQHNHDAAMRAFELAWRDRDRLDPATRQSLQDKLTVLRAPAPFPSTTAHDPSPLDEVGARQQLLREKLLREITTEQAEANRMIARDPLGALSRLQKLRDRVSQAELAPATRKQLLTLVDRSIGEAQRYIDANRSQIELDQKNQEILEGVAQSREKAGELQGKIAELVDQFNTLVDEQRYAEAEVLAKQARELDPESPVVQNLIWKSRFVRRLREQMAMEEGKDEGFLDATSAVLASSTPFDDRDPYRLPDAKYWKDLSDRRAKIRDRQGSRLTPAEMEIQQSLKKQVEARFQDRPLSEVMDSLGAMAGVNIYLDPQGLAAEGVTSDTPITINLTQPISLQSALNLILEPLRLSFVIQNEVLRVTSEQTRDSDVYTHVYNVADLVIPIPNFIPGYNVGLPAAIREALNAQGYGALNRPVGVGPLTIASNEDAGASADNRSVLAQMGATGILPDSAGGRSSRPLGFGPGGLGGAALADFDTLINLITTTVAPTTWEEVGGNGAIEPFPTNLSLVVTQTQETHDKIVDLLDQLRRLQDLQVTIEVRFITLNDSFFERIGIDFDFDIDDNVPPVSQVPNTKLALDDTGHSITIGLDPTGAPTADLDIPFTQGSFGASIPAFGGFDVGSAANFGFAILSDIEVFFLLQAAEGDTRSNVLQAPKVTLFNGQLASVFDQSQRPFVTSIIPVVGDFAAAHQPVIVVLSEGTSLSVQAVVSSDRRFVRLTLVPFFSRIGAVEEFTFTGRTTTRSGTNVIDPDGNPSGNRDDVETIQEGTTVQLPTFVFTTVSTTVSVPDGGTVLLGGIKRLSEGRNERGVPMLSKIPYVSRLFKNVGIGRETESLMMMVTPRIIIQEEEEFLQTGFDSTAQ